MYVCLSVTKPKGHSLLFPLPLAGFELGFLPCVCRCLSVELEAGNKCSPVYLPLIPLDHCVHYSLTFAPVAACVPVPCLASKVSVRPCPHCIACHGPGPRVTPEVLSAMSSACFDVVLLLTYSLPTTTPLVTKGRGQRRSFIASEC